MAAIKYSRKKNETNRQTKTDSFLFALARSSFGNDGYVRSVKPNILNEKTLKKEPTLNEKKKTLYCVI